MLMVIPLREISEGNLARAIKKLPRWLCQLLLRSGLASREIGTHRPDIIRDISAGISQGIDRAKRDNPQRYARLAQKNLAIHFQIKKTNNSLSLVPIFVEIKELDGRTLIPIQTTHVERFREAHQKLIDALHKAPRQPREYAELYRNLNIDELYRRASDLGGPPVLCKVCLEPLTGNQKIYCGNPCRNIAKVRRARERHPERKLRR